MDAIRHTCLKLEVPSIAQSNESRSIFFVKGTWFRHRFDLSITDGLNAWTCHGGAISSNYHSLSLSLISLLFCSSHAFNLIFLYFPLNLWHSDGGRGSIARRTMGPRTLGLCGVGGTAFRVSAAWFGLWVRRRWKWGQEGLCLFDYLNCFFLSVFLGQNWWGSENSISGCSLLRHYLKSYKLPIWLRIDLFERLCSCWIESELNGQFGWTV